MTLSKLAVCCLGLCHGRETRPARLRLNRAIAPKILAQTFRRDAIYYFTYYLFYLFLAHSYLE